MVVRTLMGGGQPCTCNITRGGEYFRDEELGGNGLSRKRKFSLFDSPIFFGYFSSELTSLQNILRGERRGGGNSLSDDEGGEVTSALTGDDII